MTQIIIIVYREAETEIRKRFITGEKHYLQMHENTSAADGYKRYIFLSVKAKIVLLSFLHCVTSSLLLSKYSSIAFLPSNLRCLYALNIIGLY